MNEEKLNKTYDILVNLGGANESDRIDFIYHHLNNKNIREWRFCGKFGFGGKYRIHRKSVDYYPEDNTKELDALKDKINKELQYIYADSKGKDKNGIEFIGKLKIEHGDTFIVTHDGDWNIYNKVDPNTVIKLNT